MQNNKHGSFIFYFEYSDSLKDEILADINYLQKEIKEIGEYPDMSLFFQNPQIVEGWLALNNAIERYADSGTSFTVKEWGKRTNPYVVHLLTMRDIHQKYKKLYRDYYDHFKTLLDTYGGWLQGECISSESIGELIAGQYGKDIGDVEDVDQYIADLNNQSLKMRSGLFSMLSDIQQVLIAVMNRGGHIIIDLNPSEEAFAQAMNLDLKEWTLNFGVKLIRDMKEDLTRHYKEHRTDRYTPELWSDMLDADENALNKAKMQLLADCKETRQEHWGEDMKRQMDENGRLMQQILSSCRSDELFDFGKAENIQPFIELLTTDNIEMFYEIIVRRNLIQCEMFPELKEQHEAWLNHVNEQQPEESNETGMDAARQSKLDEIIGILKNGNWKQPATADNVEKLLNTIFGKDTSLLDEKDIDECEKMWTLVENRRGGYIKEMLPANLAGFFNEENLLIGSSKEIRNELFGKNNKQSNNFNKGKKGYRSIALENVIPFLKKYIDKIIRQE